MKTYKQFVKEVAEPIGRDEKRFKALHVDAVEVVDYPVAGNEHVFKGTFQVMPRLGDIVQPDDQHYDQAYATDDEMEDDEDEQKSVASRVSKLSRMRYDGTGEGMDESVIIEAVRAGTVKLKDGTLAKITNEDANSFNKLFTKLSGENRTKMESRMTSGKDGYSEILQFAKTL